MLTYSVYAQCSALYSVIPAFFSAGRCLGARLSTHAHSCCIHGDYGVDANIKQMLLCLDYVLKSLRFL